MVSSFYGVIFLRCHLYIPGLDKEDPDPCSYAASEDPSMRLKWTAYIESTKPSVVGDLTWDMVN